MYVALGYIINSDFFWLKLTKVSLKEPISQSWNSSLIMLIDLCGRVLMAGFFSKPFRLCISKLMISSLLLLNLFAGIPIPFRLSFEWLFRYFPTHFSSFLYVARPESMHEYNLTPHSLYAAVSVGLETETIITVLNKLSKTKLPKEMIDFIQASTANYGKVKLVLKKNRYFIESPFPEVLKKLLKDEVIGKARISTEV